MGYFFLPRYRKGNIRLISARNISFGSPGSLSVTQNPARFHCFPIKFAVELQRLIIVEAKLLDCFTELCNRIGLYSVFPADKPKPGNNIGEHLNSNFRHFIFVS